MWPLTASMPVYLLIADVVKPHSAQAIKGLKQAGVRKTVMLTGDAEPVARAVSAELGLDEYHAGLLPGDKVDQIEKLLASKQPQREPRLCGRRRQRRPCSVPCGHRHCHGCSGLRRCH